MIRLVESTNGNRYCTKFKIGDKVKFMHDGERLSPEVAITPNKEGFNASFNEGSG